MKTLLAYLFVAFNVLSSIFYGLIGGNLAKYPEQFSPIYFYMFVILSFIILMDVIVYLKYKDMRLAYISFLVAFLIFFRVVFLTRG